MRADIGGVRLFFDVLGPRPDADRGPDHRLTVICLHGGPGFDHSTLRPGLDRLGDVARLVFVDHRGNGRSDRDRPERWNLDTWIDDIARFCAALDIRRPVILGQSFGGFVALGVAARHPDLVRALIVSSSAGRIRYDRALVEIARLGGREARDVAARHFVHTSHATREEYARVCLPLYNPTPSDPARAARVVRSDDVALHFWRDEIRRFDLFPELGAIVCPTLVLGGEQDPITPPADQEDLTAAISGATLQIFRGAGHGPFRDAPDEVAAAIRAFLARLPDEVTHC